jgi:exopolyphosphatase / guanosine-5'-triphosphate,3'-diphosphate pyrophosphatase
LENIIPRWEWRTFGESFGVSDDRFAALEPTSTQESDELYLLSSVTNENVKVRDLLMDIKALQRVNADGLEQWKPVLKGAFPLPAAEVKNVFTALGVAPPPLARRGLHARAVRWGAGRARRALARGAGTQEARPIQDRWLHRRDD